MCLLFVKSNNYTVFFVSFNYLVSFSYIKLDYSFILYYLYIVLYLNVVTMQALRTAPPDMQLKDKFLVQTTVVPYGTSDEELIPAFVSISTPIKCIVFFSCHTLYSK
jgi:hypothetical protein